jgi:hypothetical protein
LTARAIASASGRASMSKIQFDAADSHRPGVDRRRSGREPPSERARSGLLRNAGRLHRAVTLAGNALCEDGLCEPAVDAVANTFAPAPESWLRAHNMIPPDDDLIDDAFRTLTRECTGLLFAA